MRMVDIAGARFGRLTVIGMADRKGRLRRWACRCDCGADRVVIGQALRSGHSRSCGCLQKEAASQSATTHGLTGTPEHRIWKHMRGRCLDPNDPRFKDYGARGITICQRWESFEAFLADMGPRPSPQHSIERLDVNGNYEPGNTVWGTPKQQARNKRNTSYILHGGARRKLVEVAEETGILADTLHKRAQRGTDGSGYAI